MNTLKSFLAISFLLISLTGFSQDKQQCKGTTKAGTQCTRQTTTMYCKQHDINAIRCGAKTKAGTECKNIVKVAGLKCHNHNKTTN